MKKYYKISYILNIVIFLLVAIAFYIMFNGIKFMHGYELPLNGRSIGIFKFFTVDSNIFMGITALIFAIQELKKKEISKKYYILKLMATSSVSLTFFITFAYLSSISEYGLMPLLMNSNLFFHLIVPVLSIITFVCFERNSKLSFKDSIYGIVPTFLYGIYYLTNVLLHIENGKVSPQYDFYWFAQGGIKTAFISIPIIFLISYIISLILYRFNHKRV